ncbi:hypothetical protein L249_2100 [Ophiocordyceps polyrhachis-furcata BCC 54312]|uniref:Uncharacterized protein n=1 Tax=Ophiocordyceps polyrhachis-furcata BCC 54312 TaxID=1330021 RepID=A0A367LRT4_9HYPO|nr:hypothetical protein L249_2100 [Ophiocordyceps polyrhachis-furcata BCC 54312]
MKYAYSTFMGLVLAAPALADGYYSKSSAPAPYSTTPVIGLSCPQACENGFNACRSKPGANISTCVSERNACLATCGLDDTDEDEYSSSSAPGPAPTPYPAPKPECKTCKDSKPVIGLSCPQACENGFNACRNKPGANISTCASEKAACLATCGNGPIPPAPTPYPAPQPDCGKACEDKFNACRSKPGANISTCASEKAACLAACGQKPAPTTSSAYGDETSAPVYVGAGDSIKPTVAAWTLGLGALLMLF